MSHFAEDAPVLRAKIAAVSFIALPLTVSARSRRPRGENAGQSGFSKRNVGAAPLMHRIPLRRPYDYGKDRPAKEARIPAIAAHISSTESSGSTIAPVITPTGTRDAPDARLIKTVLRLRLSHFVNGTSTSCRRSATKVQLSERIGIASHCQLAGKLGRQSSRQLGSFVSGISQARVGHGPETTPRVPPERCR